MNFSVRLCWRTVSSGKKTLLLSKAWKCQWEDKTQFPHLQTPFTWDMVWNWDGRFRADLGVNYNLTGGYSQILNSLSTLIRFLPKIVHNLLDTCFVPLLPQKNVTGMQIPAFTSLRSAQEDSCRSTRLSQELLFQILQEQIHPLPYRSHNLRLILD